MKPQICLDTGPIYLNFSKVPPVKISKLFEEIKENKLEAFVVAPVLTEVFKHLCISNGKEFAQVCLNNLYERYPIHIVNINKSLTMKAGVLKCQYRNKLSYVDCFVIAFGLIQGIPIHTTEKELPEIYRLKTITYSF